MIFQDPQTSLNPILTVGEQLIETIQTHLNISTDEAKNKAINLLKEVGIKEAEKHDKAGKQQNIQRLTRANRHGQVLQPVRAVATAKPLRHRCREEQDRAGKNGRNHTRHVDLEG